MEKNGFNVIGGNGSGNQSNQFSSPYGIYVDDDSQCIYIADTSNHRIIQWKSDAKMEQVITGGNGEGSQTDQFEFPVDL
jgi:sugar lactone lactonase YvrE